MYKARLREGKPLAIDTQHAPCFSAPDLLSSFASRSVAEILVFYSLIFKLNTRAQQLYRKEKAKASNRLTDPLLDSFCLDNSTDSSKGL